jgi:hypothetical protein
MGLNKISTGLKGKALKKISVLYALEKAYNKCVNAQLAKVSTPILFKKNTLNIAVTSNAWAQELQFYKHKILARLKKSGYNFTKIHFVINAKYFELEENNGKEPDENQEIPSDYQQTISEITKDIKEIALKEKYKEVLEKDFLKKLKDNSKICSNCGTAVSSAETLCSVCSQEQLLQGKKLIRGILDEAPWLKFEDLNEDQLKNIKKDQFNKEKRFYITKLYDRIKQGSYELYRSGDSNLRMKLQQLSSTLVSLKTTLTPDKITEEQVIAIIGQKPYKVIFNK